ncbi:VCBS repeat-containing protein [Rhodocytophaga aerolata]|uniref:VCBS repeat-containing protein n=1 Tax=Rhodocytophaga aerolata TaxID=455078 RepID=A0ABT8R067_9BACT|nr:VCBS repeat-containing protein [Rhodocytophaga aerolata]MDO1444789.1 VCBS repeat-containing protein [Rhodocytophaga aerolata]
MRIYSSFLLCVILILSLACSKNKPEKAVLFETLPSSVTGIEFVNRITDDKEFNIFNYRNFYNGGGVAIGDINNDGLPDVFVTSNLEKNHLYLNKGNFQFEDITDKAGVGGKQAWSTGVTFADINGDGFIDIYVCNSGNIKGDGRENELFINNGNLTFTEQAAQFGLNDRGFSTHAAFFDYDRDGDLDVYLLNNSFTPIGRLGYQNLRNQRDNLGGDKLFRNDNGKWFTDVSGYAGIYGSLIGFGLGITIGDVNNDNWPDIYISNDFHERDYLYVNQKNGTYKEMLEDCFGHISLSSMGADIADINNDGNLDIFVTDMLPGDDHHLKMTSTYEGYDLQKLKLSQGYYHQYMRNMLHLNNGDETFSEIGQLAGVHATDWSWGALIFDMDNDGLKDIFVANGINRDLTDQDYISFLGDAGNIEMLMEKKQFNFQEFISIIPSRPIPNYAFRNKGNLQFTNAAQQWGLSNPGFSNGSAYGDLDNDGDLDLIVNNVNSPLSVFKNTSIEKDSTHYIRVKLKGPAGNINGIGTKVYVHTKTGTQYLQQMPNRGFQSSVDHVLVFGLGKQTQIDSLEVIWPDDQKQVLPHVKANQELVLAHKNADKQFKPASPVNPAAKPMADVTSQVALTYRHRESDFVDYNRDALLKQMYSTQGPALATGDINGDGLEDVFFGGARDKKSVLYTQTFQGTFREIAMPVFEADSASEDVAAAFFDADGDKDLDLFVVTGSNEFTPNDERLIDRLYVNDGKGNFTKDLRFPAITESGSCVAAADFDGDGDIDLFVGSRLIPGQYGYNPYHYLFVNDGTGNFKNMSKRYIPEIRELGMVTSAVWADIDKDNFPELLLVGDWMPVTIFKNVRGNRLDKITDPALATSSGWWNSIYPADVDQDGDTDFVLGNLGINSRLKASAEQPAELYVHDYDANGSVEQIITCYAEDGKSYPMVLKADLQKRLPMVKKKFVKFSDYAGKGIKEVFTTEELQGATIKTVNNPHTSILVNKGNATFDLQPLPVEAQFSPVYGIQALDYNEDGITDLLLTGNFYEVLPEIGRYDANYGLILKGTGQGKFEAVLSKDSGFFVKGQVRAIREIRGANNQQLLILAKNNDSVQVYAYKKHLVQ